MYACKTYGIVVCFYVKDAAANGMVTRKVVGSVRGVEETGFGRKQPRYLCGHKLPTQLPFGLHRGVTCHIPHHNLATAQHVACENESWNRWVGRQGSPASREPVKPPKRTNTQHSEKKQSSQKNICLWHLPGLQICNQACPCSIMLAKGHP